MFKTILVPTDASEPAQRALMITLELAKEFDSRIILLHVVFTPEAMGIPFRAEFPYLRMKSVFTEKRL